MLGVTRRMRLARRADRVWRSVYLRQHLMVCDPKPLTTSGRCETDSGVRPSQLDVSDGPTDTPKENV
jgi:hypothetical protein